MPAAASTAIATFPASASGAMSPATPARSSLTSTGLVSSGCGRANARNSRTRRSRRSISLLMMRAIGRRVGRIVAAIEAALEHGELQRRRIERVADLVRQAGGHRPHRGQPLGTEQPAEHLLLVGDVDADRVDGGPVVAPLHLGAAPANLALAAGLDRQVDRARVRRHEAPPVRSEHLGPRVAGDAFELAIPGRDLAGLVEREHEGGDGLDQLAVHRLGAFELCAQPLALAIESGLLEGPTGRVEQIRRRDGLENVGERRAAHGGDRALDRRVAGHHHRLQERRARAQRRRAETCRPRRGAARRSARRRSRARPRGRARSPGRARSSSRRRGCR